MTDRIRLRHLRYLRYYELPRNWFLIRTDRSFNRALHIEHTIWFVAKVGYWQI